MKRLNSSEAVPYIVAISFGVLGGLALWFWGAPTSGVFDDEELNSSALQGPAGPMREATQRAAAVAYIEAVQGGDCGEVVRLTGWMRARLARMQSEGASAEAMREARDGMCASITSRIPDENQLSLEGVEDQYVFTPRSRYTVLGADDGRADLSERVAERVWVRVDYEKGPLALRDEEGQPMRSVTVGLNLSDQGYVIKGGIRGNLDIAQDRPFSTL